MKTVYQSITKHTGIVVFCFLSITITISCVDYLNKAPEVSITEDDVFSSFPKFQGFVENMYECMRVLTSGGQYAETNFNFGGDENVVGGSTGTLSYQFERGNYLRWYSSGDQSLFTKVSNKAVGAGNRGQGHWESGWGAIRKANMAIENIEKLENATQEERDILLGQAYFFRAYFHFEILRAWGHIAFIDVVYSADDEIRPETQTYKYVADRIEDDLLKAIPLLPVDWDQTVVGKRTEGNNRGRVTKGAAYSYLALNRLYAASPLMNGEETGSFTYNRELCRQAAEAYHEVIKLADQGVYVLQPWDEYSKIFYTTLSTERPIKCKEIIWSNLTFNDGTSMSWQYADFTFNGTGGGWGCFAGPTENYVRYFGMANGLPLDEPDSGFDPTDPWVNRDPRFYYNIICDGDVNIQNDPNHADRYFQFFVGGNQRNAQNTLTGYAYKKFRDVTFNNIDNGRGSNLYFDCPKVRLAGVYLEYAEAANEAYGPNGGVPGGLTAIQAVNLVRARAGVPEVDDRYLTSAEKFREIIWQERAVELAFESHRWFDLRRWYVADQPKYREKWILNMDKDHTYFQSVLYATTVFEAKHWWLPFRVREHVSISPIFKQNPGW